MGSPVAAFYGSNVLWPQVPIIVDDPVFEDAYETLCANFFEYFINQTVQPPKSDTEGEEGKRRM